MKLSEKQRERLFELVQDKVLKNPDNINIVSSDHPNRSFIYKDDEYEIIYYYNQFGMGVTTGDIVQISLYDKKYDDYIKFDSGDYMFMKNRQDMMRLVENLHINIFKEDDTDNENEELINKILGLL